MTPPNIVPCALVSLGISTTRMAGSCPGVLYSNPVFDSFILQQPNPSARLMAKRRGDAGKERRGDAATRRGKETETNHPSLPVSPHRLVVSFLSPRLRVAVSPRQICLFPFFSDTVADMEPRDEIVAAGG